MPAPAAPPTRPPLSPWDHLVLIGWQIKFNLDKAQQKWEHDFRDQLKTYLLTRPEGERELTSAGVIKVSIVKKGGNEPWSINNLEEAFKNMFRNPPDRPTLTLNDIRTLFETGVLGVKKPDEAFAFLAAHRMADNPLLFKELPTPVTQSLTWKVLDTAAQNGAAVLADLPDRIHTASGARLDDQDIALMMPQAMPLTELEPRVNVTRVELNPETGASETVAVRRPRRNRNQP